MFIILDNLQAMSLADYDLPCIAGTLKKFLRELPDPVIPEQYYNKFIEAGSKSNQLNTARFLFALVFLWYWEHR